VGEAAGRPGDSRPILVVDFDGTVYRGDAPTRFYARRIAEALPERAARSYLDVFEHYLGAGVKAADDYEDAELARALRGAYDGWGAAYDIARVVFEVDREVLQEAFPASRVYMLSDECEVEVVAPLVQVLGELRGEIRIVLATNSPAEGLAPLLDRIGVSVVFGEVVAGAAKPEGLRQWMAAALEGRPASGLFSLGDHYRNEIEPAVAIGAAAGYIDRFGRVDGPATVTAAQVEDILPALRSWAHDVL
jgi:FMN phosphatase YigB (HAD superfamily)